MFFLYIHVLEKVYSSDRSNGFCQIVCIFLWYFRFKRWTRKIELWDLFFEYFDSFFFIYMLANEKKAFWPMSHLGWGRYHGQFFNKTDCYWNPEEEKQTEGCPVDESRQHSIPHFKGNSSRRSWIRPGRHKAGSSDWRCHSQEKKSEHYNTHDTNPLRAETSCFCILSRTELSAIWKISALCHIVQTSSTSKGLVAFYSLSL